MINKNKKISFYLTLIFTFFLTYSFVNAQEQNLEANQNTTEAQQNPQSNLEQPTEATQEINSAQPPVVTPPQEEVIQNSDPNLNQINNLNTETLDKPITNENKEPAIEIEKFSDSSKEKQKVKKMFAVLETTMGTIKIKLFHRRTPKTVENFVGLAEGTKEFRDPKSRKKVTGKKFYDGLTFHRVVPNYIIQTGDPLANNRGGPGYKFNDEPSNSLKHNKPGMVSMANAGPNSNGSQFFITLTSIPELDFSNPKNRYSRRGNTIFGEVIEGLDVVKAISEAPRDPLDKPRKEIILKSVTIERH